MLVYVGPVSETLDQHRPAFDNRFVFTMFTGMHIYIYIYLSIEKCTYKQADAT